MRIINTLLPKEHRIIITGDWHFGSAYCSSDMLEAMIDKVLEDDRTYMAINGDLAEAISVDDPRFDLGSHALSTRVEAVTPVQQYGMLQKKLEPISDKIIVCNTGNHDMKLEKKAGNLLGEMCTLLGVQYGGYTSKTHIYRRTGGGTKERCYSMLLWHGHGSVNSRVDDPRQRRRNMLRSARRKLRGLADDCEVMGMGHVHRLLLDPPEETLRIYDDGSEIRGDYGIFPTVETNGARYIHPDSRWYTVTGTSMRTQLEGEDGYQEIAGYAPVPIGWVELNYNVDEPGQDGRGISMETVRYK